MTDEPKPFDLETALLYPASAFGTPEALLARSDIDDDTKIELLRRWEYDARELEVEEEESMQAHDDDLLARIHQALRGLGVRLDLESGPPTKQSGISSSALRKD